VVVAEHLVKHGLELAGAAFALRPLLFAVESKPDMLDALLIGTARPPGPPGITA
jgi:hypothetical protein